MSDLPEQKGATKTLPIVVGAESEIGRREENQDHMTGFTSRFGAVYVVADGMGGHRGGAEASRMVTEGLRTHLLATSPGVPLEEAVSQAARLTNRDVFEKSSSGDPNYAGMGSTLSLIVIGEGSSGVELVTGHVGDSRVYLDRGGHLSLLTKDHTYVQRLVDSKMIDEEAARTHPEASVLTRAMGQTADVTIDIGNPVPLADGDGILLCSDGLSGYVPLEAIEETVHRNPGASECAKALVQLALDSGSDDNVTVQFVRFGSAPAASAAAPPAHPKRRHKTLQESQALPALGADDSRSAKHSRPATGRSFLLFGILALVLLLCAVGVFAFRTTLFPAPKAVSEGPVAIAGNHADDLRNQANALHERAAKDRIAAQNQLARLHQNDPEFTECQRIRDDLQRYEDETNALEARASDLSNRANQVSTKGTASSAEKKKIESDIKAYTAKLKTSETQLSQLTATRTVPLRRP